MAEGLVHVSGLIDPEHLELIKAIGGEKGISAGLRAIVCAGVAATRAPSPALLQEVDELRHLVDRLSTVTGRTTPAGGWWCPNDSGMPPPELLDPAGDVLACGEGRRVILAGSNGAAMLDLAEGRFVLQVGEHSEEFPADVHHIAGLVVAWMQAMVSMESGPGRRPLGNGLILTREPDGWVSLRLRSLVVAFASPSALAFPAELLALLSREALVRVGEVAQLERSLEVTP